MRQKDQWGCMQRQLRAMCLNWHSTSTTISHSIHFDIHFDKRKSTAESCCISVDSRWSSSKQSTIPTLNTIPQCPNLDLWAIFYVDLQSLPVLFLEPSTCNLATANIKLSWKGGGWGVGVTRDICWASNWIKRWCKAERTSFGGGSANVNYMFPQKR